MNPLNRYKNAQERLKKSLNSSTKLWRSKNPEKIKAIRKKTDAKRKLQRKEKILKNSFNLTYSEFIEKIKSQKIVPERLE